MESVDAAGGTNNWYASDWGGNMTQSQETQIKLKM
jgi:hypothetical protein